MKNKIGAGRVANLTAPYACAAGDGALIGSLFGVACADVAEGDDGEFELEGAYELPKAVGEIGQGAVLYWDDATRLITTVAEGNTRVGAALAAVAASDVTAQVRLNGTV